MLPTWMSPDYVCTLVNQQGRKLDMSQAKLELGKLRGSAHELFCELSLKIWARDSARLTLQVLTITTYSTHFRHQVLSSSY